MIENLHLVVGYKYMKERYTIDPINIEQRDEFLLYKHEQKNGQDLQRG